VITREKMSPAITVNRDRGAADVGGVTFCERPGEGDAVTETFSAGVETGEGVIVVGDSSLGTTVMTLLRVFVIAGLLALTKY
jgi:ABC-type taurine transport system ATPase subunit